MKNSPNLKFGLRLLVLAGALTPFVASGEMSATAAAEGSSSPIWSYEEGATTENLQRIQSAKPMSSMRGAQGPVRYDFVEQPRWSYEEGATTENLQRIQSAKSMGSMPGSEGPFRTEFAEPPTWQR